MTAPRDHGGGLDAAVALYGGARRDWLDLSTGINPVPYPVPDLPPEAWTALPDARAREALTQAARAFWQVPPELGVMATPGASAPIAQIPHLFKGRQVSIPGPTYNEHAAAFAAAGWQVDSSAAPDADLRVIVNPNNPDGRLWSCSDLTGPHVIDESFADITPGASLLPQMRACSVMLKSFGKFWGLAGLRLGFVIAAPDRIARLAEALGPWPVSGIALAVGQAALRDTGWAVNTRARLAEDAARLDALMGAAGAQVAGGTDLFRLYRVTEASAWQERLARGRVWSRVFPYDPTWLRLGLPAPDRWAQLEAAL